jgi:copper chaperone CopZ
MHILEEIVMTRLTLLAAIVIVTALGCERTDTASVPAETKTAPSETATVETVANTTVVRFDVEGMTCGGCANAIQETVKRMDGVVECEVSYPDASAVVTVTDATLATAVADTINEMEGFSARPAEDAGAEAPSGS